jgi:hypothetical protein
MLLIFFTNLSNLRKFNKHDFLAQFLCISRLVFWGPFRRWQAINSAFSVAKKPDVTLLSALWHVAGRDVVPARTAVQPWSTVVLPCPRGVS